ncbi:hypothetical protein ACN93_15110 [Gordonia paraffinivorans]|nr:hypothetical protein ACN93_15110 [Gordonia paraffinivorans]
MLSPCLACGEPTDGPRCGPCAYELEQITERPTREQRGYDKRWRRLSERARKLQPFCEDCGATTDLTADHSPEAWRRRARGLAVRLQDVAVVCQACNNRRGRARPSPGQPDPRGGTPCRTPGPPAGESDFAREIPYSETQALGGGE